MFMGEYQHTIDAKGRLTMPAKFRDELGDKFVVTKGLDHCLFVYSQAEWHIMEDKLKALSFTRADARAFARMFFSGAAEGEMDKQNRVLLPQNLREHAELHKDVIVVGVSTRVEIWDKEKWQAYNDAASADYEILAEKLVDFDL